MNTKSPSEFLCDRELCCQTTTNKLPGYNAKHTSRWARWTIYSHAGCLVSLKLSKVTGFLFKCTHTNAHKSGNRNGLYLNICWDLNLCFTPSFLFLSLPLLHGWTDRLAGLRTTGWVCFFRRNSSPSQREKKNARLLGKSSQKIPSFQHIRTDETYATFGSPAFFLFFSQKGSKSTSQQVRSNRRIYTGIWSDPQPCPW